MSYQDYKKKVAVGVMGQYLELPMWKFAESVDTVLASGDDFAILEFIACLDSFQEDAEFTENLAKLATTTYVDWFVEADIKRGDPMWHKEVVEFYKGIVEKLED